MKNTLWRWVILAFGFMVAVIMFLAATSCAPARVPVGFQHIRIIRAPLRDSTVGVTVCDDQGEVAIIIDNRLDDRGVYFTEIHERQHVADMEQIGTCRLFSGRYSASGKYRFQAETNAWCAEYDAVEREEMLPQEAFDSLASFLKRKYAPGLSIDSVRKVMPCGRQNGHRPP